MPAFDANENLITQFFTMLESKSESSLVMSGNLLDDTLWEPGAPCIPYITIGGGPWLVTGVEKA